MRRRRRTLKARKFQSNLETEIKKSKGERKQSLETILKTIKNDEGAYPQQMLVPQIAYLSYIVGDADKIIGKDMKERYAELVATLKKLQVEANI